MSSEAMPAEENIRRQVNLCTSALSDYLDETYNGWVWSAEVDRILRGDVQRFVKDWLEEHVDQGNVLLRSVSLTYTGGSRRDVRVSLDFWSAYGSHLLSALVRSDLPLSLRSRPRCLQLKPEVE